MKILSKIPGRIRAKEAKIYRNEELAQLLEIYLSNLPGIHASNVNPIIGTFVIYYDPDRFDQLDLESRIDQILTAESPYLQHIHENYQEFLVEEGRLKAAQEKMLIFGGLYLALKIKHLFFGKFSPSRSLPILGVAAILSIINGYPALQKIIKKLEEYFPSSSDKFLLGLGLILTILREGDGILFLFLQSLTEGIEANSRLQMKQLLLANSPNPMNLVWSQKGEATHLVPYQSLQVGDQVIFSPNDTILMDGKVIHGEALVNLLYYTGQPNYQKLQLGDEAREGMVLQTGSITIQITDLSTRTAKPDLNLEDLEILQLARSYQKKSTYIAAGLAVLGYGVTGTLLTPLATFLVMNPAIIQVSLTAGVTNYLKLLLKNKLLLRNVNTFEKIIQSSKIVFDKTGTLTDGRLFITQIDSLDPAYTKERILELCTSCAATQLYPAAFLNEKVITTSQSQQSKLDQNEVRSSSDSQLHSEQIYLPVAGTQSPIPGNPEQQLHIRTREMLYNGDLAIPEPKATPEVGEDQNVDQGSQRAMILYVSIDHKMIGQIHLIEKIEAHVPQAINQLKEHGFDKIAIISGDQPGNVQRVAEELHLSEYHSQMTRVDKARYIAQEKEAGPLIMVGDGINDALAMETADLSISYQQANAQVTLSSDCILLEKDLALIPKLVELTEQSYQAIEKNLKYSWYYSIFFGALASFGYLTLFQAEAMKTFNLINSILSSGTISQLDVSTLKELFLPIPFEKLDLWDQEKETHFVPQLPKKV